MFLRYVSRPKDVLSVPVHWFSKPRHVLLALSCYRSRSAWLTVLNGDCSIVRICRLSLISGVCGRNGKDLFLPICQQMMPQISSVICFWTKFGSHMTFLDGVAELVKPSAHSQFDNWLSDIWYGVSVTHSNQTFDRSKLLKNCRAGGKDTMYSALIANM